MFMKKNTIKKDKNGFKEENVKKNEDSNKSTIIKENNIKDEHDDAVQMAQLADYKNTNSNIDKNKNNYVGFWVRYAAITIDSIIVLMVTTPIVFIMGIFIAIINSYLDNVIVTMILNVVSYLISFSVGLIYYTMTTNYYQATFGKMAVGAKVEAENGKKLEIKSLIIREIIKSVTSIALPILHVIIAFTNKKQGLHDFAVKSVVVYADSTKRARKWVVGIVLALEAFVITFIIFIIILIAVVALNAIEKSDFDTDGMSVEKIIEDIEDNIDINLDNE